MTQFPQAADILLTGAGGRLGRLLRHAAARDGTGPRRLAFQSRRPGTGLTWAPGDALSALPRCDTVVALWGRTGGDAAALAENGALVAFSHAVAMACGARRLFHLSSAAVYGPGRHMNEATPPRPAAEYGRAKLAMEGEVAGLPRNDRIAHGILRLANVVGADSLAPGLRGAGPVGMDRFEDGGGPIRSYIAPGDLLRVLTGLADLQPDDLPDTLNIAAPAPVRMEDLVGARRLDVDWRPAPPSATHEVSLDAARISALLPGAIRHQTAAAMVDDWAALEAPA
ncbi:MAG: NAD-dependent epimerase/dehydratase family protein [Roseovarius sp.]